jgi:hypothetical protein
MIEGLSHIRVVDLSSDIAGPYCSKLLADAGADVVKVEPVGGDPMRRYTATGVDLRGEDSALFHFLNTSKRSVVGEPGDPEVDSLVAGADILIDDGQRGVDLDARRARDPSPGERPPTSPCRPRRVRSSTAAVRSANQCRPAAESASSWVARMRRLRRSRPRSVRGARA